MLPATILISLLLPLAALAEEGRQVSCRFLALGDGGPKEATVHTKEGGEIVCPLPTTKMSDPVACPVDGETIRFVGSDDSAPLATATVPTGVAKAIIVFLPTPAKPDGGEGPKMRTLIIDDSAGNFPAGGTFVVNFHSSDARFVIGEHRDILKPGTSRGYAMPEKRNDFNMSPVIFELYDGERWRTANESSLRFHPRVRYLIFTYVDSRTKRPRVRTIQDVSRPQLEP